MDIALKLVAAALAAAIVTSAIKKDSPSMSLLIAVAAGAVMLSGCLSAFKNVTEFARDIAAVSGVSSPIFSTILKTVGIAIIARFASDICRDAGLITAATASDFCAAVTALYISIPVMKIVFQMIKDLM